METKDKIEYHDDCPKCKTTMKGIKDNNNLVYYCKKCNQKYRIDVIHKSQDIECPHCEKKIRLTHKNISDLHMNTVFNYYSRKVKIK